VKDDDPEWLERWKTLSPAERTRIAAATRSGALLASHEEIELAAGFARRDRRRLSPWTLANVIRLLLGIALIAGGLAADSIILLVFGVLFLFGGIWARATATVSPAPSARRSPATTPSRPPNTRRFLRVARDRHAGSYPRDRRRRLRRRLLAVRPRSHLGDALAEP
jgi:hypothetical protein